MANNGCVKYRAASSHEKRQSAIDQNIHRPLEPSISDVKAALGWIPYPRMTLGLAPHPIKGAAISSSTLRMPNLTQLLNGFARGKDPNSHYATVSIQRCEGRDPSAPSEQTLGVGTYIINGAKGNGAREGQITWTLCFFTLEPIACRQPHTRSSAVITFPARITHAVARCQVETAKGGPASRKSHRPSNNASEGNTETLTLHPGASISNPRGTTARGARTDYGKEAGRGHPKTRPPRNVNRCRRVGDRQSQVMHTLASAGRNSWRGGTTKQGADHSGDMNGRKRMKTASGSAIPLGSPPPISQRLHEECAATGGRESDRVGATPHNQ